MTRHRLLIDAEVHAHLPQLPRDLQNTFVDICSVLSAKPTPPEAEPVYDIPGAYRYESLDLVVLYTVETDSINVWRVHVNR